MCIDTQQKNTIARHRAQHLTRNKKGNEHGNTQPAQTRTKTPTATTTTTQPKQGEGTGEAASAGAWRTYWHRGAIPSACVAAILIFGAWLKETQKHK